MNKVVKGQDKIEKLAEKESNSHVENAINTKYINMCSLKTVCVTATNKIYDALHPKLIYIAINGEVSKHRVPRLEFSNVVAHRYVLHSLDFKDLILQPKRRLLSLQVALPSTVFIDYGSQQVC